MKKPSEIFEGENSSLRKTFDEATKDNSIEAKIGDTNWRDMRYRQIRQKKGEADKMVKAGYPDTVIPV
jgi:hypothetical protein